MPAGVQRGAAGQRGAGEGQLGQIQGGLVEDFWRRAASGAGVSRRTARELVTQLTAALGELRAEVGACVSHVPVESMPPALVGLLQRADRAIGAAIEKNSLHDAGAYARCSYCGRYSVSPLSIATTSTRFVCDCGRAGGWSGSFVAPGPDAVWSIHHVNLVTVSVDVAFAAPEVVDSGLERG